MSTAAVRLTEDTDTESLGPGPRGPRRGDREAAVTMRSIVQRGVQISERQTAQAPVVIHL